MLAIVERAQVISRGGLSHTIKDQVYSIMSITPAVIYNRVFSLSNSYLRRISDNDTRRYLKESLTDITSRISTDNIPMRLSLEDQGRFALGYQHQHQSLYTKTNKIDEHDN